MAIYPGEGVCYTDQPESATLRSHSLLDGTLQWETEHRVTAYAIVPSSEGPFVSGNCGLEAFDLDGNQRYWAQSDRGCGPAGIAIADAVYFTDVHRVQRFKRRSLWRSEGFMDQPPAAEWVATEHIDFGAVPAVDDGDVFVADEAVENRTMTGGVVGLDESGTVRWYRELGWEPAGMAIGPERVFVAMWTIDDDDTPRHAFHALRRADGETEWDLDPDGLYRHPKLAGDTLLLAESTPEQRGRLHGLTPEGEFLWTVSFDADLWDFAPVGDRIYAVTGEHTTDSNQAERNDADKLHILS